MDSAISRYRQAYGARNTDALMETLAPDVEVVSPISGRMVFRGHDDVRILLDALYGTLNGLRWTEAIGDGDRRVLLGEMRVGAIRMTDAMVFELAPDGHIIEDQPSPAALACADSFRRLAWTKGWSAPGSRSTGISRG